MLKFLSVLLVFNLPGVYFENIDLKNTINYGPYAAEFNYFNLSYQKIGKIVDISTAQITKEKNDYIAHINSSIGNQIRIDEIKIFVYKNNNTKNMLWNYRLRNPCQHYAMARILKEYYDIDNNCIIKKGNYICEINLSELSRKFFGTSSFYGDFVFKVNTISGKMIIISVTTNTSFIKKT